MRQLALGLALVSLVAAALVAWATPRPLGDLYLALAAGRDVLDGKIGGPDTWAFTTEGRTWVNPSWLSGVLFVLVERAGGGPALLALKGALIGGLAGLLVWSSRSRGAALPAALLAAALALGASPQDLMLRPNLLSLLFVPVLLVLMDAPALPSVRGWGILGLFGLWANVHGGFVFGLLLLGLRALAGFRAGPGPGGSGRQPGWFMPLVFAGALAVTAFVNPFGWENLYQQISVPRTEAWKTVTEWRPLLAPRLPGVAFPWVFLVTAGFVLLAAAARIPAWLRPAGRTRTVEGRRILFDAVVFTSVILLAFSARRLVPWAAVAMAPLVALTLEKVLTRRRFRVSLAVAAAAVLVMLTVPQRWLVRHYDPENPLFPREPVLERMILAGTHLPGGAAGFLAGNEVRARAFHEWRWEGYLRWTAPEIGLYLGGRAQQVYDEAVALERKELLAAGDPGPLLARRGIGLVVVPLTFEYGPLCQRLLVGEGTSWAYVYADRYSAILADRTNPATRELVLAAARGELVYPDSASAMASRGLCLASPAVASSPGEPVEFLAGAQALEPAGYLYPILVNQALAAGTEPEQVFRYLEGEWGRLLDRGTHRAEANALLEARLFLGAELLRILPPQAEEARRRVERGMEEARARIREIGRAYPAYYRAEPRAAPAPTAPGPRG